MSFLGSKTESKSSTLDVIMKLPDRSLDLGKTAIALVAGGVSSYVFMMSGQVDAKHDSCTDVAHQQVVVEDGFRAGIRSFFEIGGVVEGEQTIKGVTNMLTSQRGYSISKDQLIEANAKNIAIIYDEKDNQPKEKLDSGIYCIDVPGPVYAGFERVESHDNLTEIASANLVSVDELKKLNPAFEKTDPTENLTAGVTLRVSPNPNEDYVYREMTREEGNINTISNGDTKKRAKLLKLNASILGLGGSVGHGEKAWLPLEETEWMKENKINIDDIRTAFPTTEITKKDPNAAPKEVSPDNKDKVKISHEASVKATDSLAKRGEQWRHRAEAMRYFIDQGCEDYQAAGLIGSFVIESGNISLPADIHQHYGGPGRGIAQWEGGRRVALMAFAKQKGTSWTDFDTQLDFVMKEFNTNERRAYNWLMSTDNVTEATNAVLNGYERPAARKIDPRLAHAKDILYAYRAEAMKYQ